MNRIYPILSLILCFADFSCGENVKLKESDIKKYPWLQPFLIEKLDDFEGLHHIDLAEMSFSYKTSLSGLEQYDSIAQSEKWIITHSTTVKREYSKKLNLYPAEESETIMKIHLDTVRHRLIYTIR